MRAEALLGTRMNARDVAVAVRALAWFVGGAFIAMAVIGVMRRYSPVPTYDIWAAVRFYARLAQGDYGVWWIQHLEHRIVLPKILYWIDWRLFGAREISLLVENFLLLGTLGAVLWFVARKLIGADAPATTMDLLAMLLAVFCFSWMQEENLVRGFQVAFVLAYLVPLLAFVALAKSAEWSRRDPVRGRRWFVGSVVAGVAALGTMANGVLVLPLLAASGIALRQPGRRVAIVVATAVVAISAFSIGYVTPAHHRQPLEGMIHNGRDVSLFLLRLLGSPIHGVVDNPIAAELAGALVIAAAMTSAIRWWRGKARPPLQLALIVFLAYAILSAAAAAGGRAHFGLDYAFSSRYRTTALLTWAALAVSILSQSRGNRFAHRLFTLFALISAVAFVPSQLAAFDGDATALRHHEAIAALALELGARDIDATHWIFPNERVFERAEEARAQRVSIFSNPLYAGLRETIGLPATTLGLRGCNGFIESIAPLDSQSEVARIRGWAFEDATGRTPPRVYIVGADGIIVGVAVTGASRPDVAAAVHPAAGDSGFDGYQMRPAPGKLQLQCAAQ